MITHNAPPVIYPIAASRFQGALLLGIWLLGLLVASMWVSMTGVLDWRAALMLAAILGSGAAAYVSWKNTPVGQLEWNGEAWRWESSSYLTGVAEQRLFVIVDLQHTLLLRLENQANANLWIWAQRSSFSDRWLDLRRAVFATRKKSSISTRKKLGPPLQLSSGTKSARASLVNGVTLKP